MQVSSSGVSWRLKRCVFSFGQRLQLLLQRCDLVLQQNKVLLNARDLFQAELDIDGERVSSLRVCLPSVSIFCSFNAAFGARRQHRCLVPESVDLEIV